MFNHVKLICLSVGLLVGLGGLNTISFAAGHAEAQMPAAAPPVTALTLHTAQNKVITSSAFRAIAFSF